MIKLLQIFPNFVKLLESSTLTSSPTSHAFHEKIFVNKIFVIQEKFMKIMKFLDHRNLELYNITYLTTPYALGQILA